MTLNRGTEHGQNGRQLYDFWDGSWACRVQVRRIGAVHLHNVRRREYLQILRVAKVEVMPEIL